MLNLRALNLDTQRRLAPYLQPVKHEYMEQAKLAARKRRERRRIAAELRREGGRRARRGSGPARQEAPTAFSSWEDLISRLRAPGRVAILRHQLALTRRPPSMALARMLRGSGIVDACAELRREFERTRLTGPQANLVCRLFSIPRLGLRCTPDVIKKASRIYTPWLPPRIELSSEAPDFCRFCEREDCKGRDRDIHDILLDEGYSRPVYREIHTAQERE
jgi:hypothetical protein